MPSDKKLFIQEELLWKELVARREFGSVEVKTPVGSIDVVNYKSIYEVKHIRKWKHALGQVLAYGYFHKEKDKNLYLFGESTQELRDIISNICASYEVNVKFTNFLFANEMRDIAKYRAEVKKKHESK